MSPGKKFFVGAALVLGLIAIVLYAVHFRCRLAVRSYKAELLAKGEKLAIADVRPKLLAAKENAAEALIPAMQQMPAEGPVTKETPPRAMRIVVPGRAMVGWSQPALHSDKKTNSWGDLAKELEASASHLAEIRAALRFHGVSFHLNYEQGFGLLLPHLAQLKRAAQRFSAAVISDLHGNQPASAFTNLMSLIALARVPHDERLVISELVRIAVTHIALAVTWESLQAPGWTDEQLQQLQAEWQKLEFLGAIQNCFLTERAMAMSQLNRFRRSSAELNKAVGLFAGGGPPAAASSGSLADLLLELVEVTGEFFRDSSREFLWRWYWSYVDELRFLRIDQLLIDSAQAARSNRSYHAIEGSLESGIKALGMEDSQPDDENIGYMCVNGIDLRCMFSEGALTLKNALRRAMVTETARELVIAAIALKRYELKHGRKATNLQMLVPDLLKELPRDYMDGRVLRYHLNPEGTFLLYSVGEDGQDDQGDPNPAKGESKAWSNGRDFVWPQPATQDEVDASNAKAPK